MLSGPGLAALDLARRGIPVFPLHTPVPGGLCSCGNDACGRNTGKHPRLKHGLTGASAVLETVTGWWDRWPAANIGAATGPGSGFWVLDVDATTPGEAWLARRVAEHGELPPTRKARTGGGGVHHCWRFDAALLAWLDANGLDLPSRNGEVLDEDGAKLKGIDVKAAGGYIVVAPSLHRLGGVYEWLDTRPTVPAPEWLLRAVCRPRPVQRAPAPTPRAAEGDSYGRKWGLSALKNTVAKIAGLTEGQHDGIRAGARLIGGIVAGGYLERGEAEKALLDAGVALGRKPGEVQRAVTWGLNKGALEPIQKPPSRKELKEERNASRPRPGSAGESRGVAAALPEDHPTPPDLDDEDEQHREEPPPPESEFQGSVPPSWPHLTDVGNAQLLVRLHGESLRFCKAMTGEGWLVWDGCRWAPDEVLGALRMGSEVGEWWRERATETRDPEVAKAVAKWAGQTEGIQRIRGMLDLSKASPKIAVRHDALDVDRMLFNAPNLTLDLRAGRAYPARREDLITRKGGCPAIPGASCPTWLAFLDQIMGGDQTLVDFLQRAVGYSLTGDTSEQCLFILHGNGANGKSTFIEAIRSIMGDYARNTPMETFTVRREGGIPNDVAALATARFVTAAESQEGVSLNEALVKQATGDDVVTARFLNREFFDFLPAFKVWMSLNHKPGIRGTDNGIWRRLMLIPFLVTIPKHLQDKGLKAKLQAEASGILQWAIDGCAEWKIQGLNAPEAVRAATDAYRTEMDAIKGYLDDCCEVGPTKGPTPVRELYRAYVDWSKDNGTHPRAAKWFSQQLDLKGIRENPRHGGGRTREGVALIVSAPPPFAGDGWRS